MDVGCGRVCLAACFRFTTASGQGYAHAPLGPGVMLAEKQHLGIGFAQGLRHAVVGDRRSLAVGQNYPAGSGSQAVDRRDRQAQHRP